MFLSQESYKYKEFYNSLLPGYSNRIKDNEPSCNDALWVRSAVWLLIIKQKWLRNQIDVSVQSHISLTELTTSIPCNGSRYYTKI